MVQIEKLPDGPRYSALPKRDKSIRDGVQDLQLIWEESNDRHDRENFKPCMEGCGRKAEGGQAHCVQCDFRRRGVR